MNWKENKEETGYYAIIEDMIFQIWQNSATKRWELLVKRPYDKDLHFIDYETIEEVKDAIDFEFFQEDNN